MSVVENGIAIIGEGLTEWYYFDSVRTANRFQFKVAPSFPSHSDITCILHLAQRYINSQYDYVICLIDMDRLNNVKAEMDIYRRRNKILKKGKLTKVMFIETNPCTEFWFLLHFMPTLSTRVYRSCDDLLLELRKYMPGYEKTKHYFRNIKLYEFLKENGDLKKAMTYSERLCELSKESPQDEHSYSEIYKVFQLLATLKQ